MTGFYKRQTTMPQTGSYFGHRSPFESLGEPYLVVFLWPGLLIFLLGSAGLPVVLFQTGQVKKGVSN
jgi:hypothetical protein